MKYVHFEASGMLAGLATMLEYCGCDTEDYQIAFGMNAPWLFLRDNDHFIAGQGLYTPRWMNLYLQSLGFRLLATTLPKEEVPAFLRLHHPAMLRLSFDHGNCHPAVCTAYESSRYHFANVKAQASPEADALSLSRSMLLRRLDATVNILALESRPAESADFIPLLVQSLHTLTAYEHAILEACTRTVTREDLNALRTPLLRALLVDMLPMALLLQEPVLYEELRLLNHDYRHIFTQNTPATVELWDRLPRNSIRECLAWLRENIVDRLYDLGLTDEEVDEALRQCRGFQ